MGFSYLLFHVFPISNIHYHPIEKLVLESLGDMSIGDFVLLFLRSCSVPPEKAGDVGVNRIELKYMEEAP